MTTGVSSGTGSGPLRLTFDAGTLVVEGLDKDQDPGLPGIQYDPRTKVFRAEAIWYRSLVEHIRKQGIAYTDQARGYVPIPWKLQVTKEAFPHQVEGLEAWWKAGGRGVVVLPRSKPVILPAAYSRRHADIDEPVNRRDHDRTADNISNGDREQVLENRGLPC